jgi:predicted dehydrogenase
MEPGASGENAVKKPVCNIALIGSGFMGRAHSNAFRQVRSFFDLPVDPVLKVLGARNAEAGAQIAQQFGWDEVVSDWRAIVDRRDIQVIDIGTPVHTHAEIAIAALRAGKAVICEKPLAVNLIQARHMARAAAETGMLNLCTYNIRFAPAVAQSRQMIAAGWLGQINQWRAAYQQSWLVNPDFPLTWRLRKEEAGSGALGDLGSHSLDLARFLVGEVQEVSAMLHTFTPERWLPVKDQGRASVSSHTKGQVTVDDSAWALLRFADGARGTMEATRMATGRLNANRFEIYGSEGALAYDFTRMNELEYFSYNEPPAQQGWRSLHVTQPVHPYAGNWWPPGHSLGYEHTFTNMLADFFLAYAQGEMTTPDFQDAARTQAVLEAIEKSNASGGWEEVDLSGL